MNRTSLLRELEASMNDPDYYLIIARVSGKFLARLIYETHYLLKLRYSHLNTLLYSVSAC